MKETFKFEKSFGPVASFSGYVILVVGLVAIYFSLTGLILIIIGAFIGLTTSSTTIDYANRKAKYSNSIFGFLPIGKWMDIPENLSIGIKKYNKTYRTYSRSNRVLDIAKKQFKIYVFDLKGNPIIPLKTIDSLNDSGKELEDLSKKLGLTIIQQ